MDLTTVQSKQEDSLNVRGGKTNLSPALLEYCQAHEHSERLYGENTLLMMQIGSFLEMYELRLEGGRHVGNASIMASSLNQMKETPLPVSGRDVKWYNGVRVERILSYGFTLLEESKKTYIGIATRKGFTVPVYYQVGKDHSRGIEKRECLEVWSPMVRPGDSDSSSRWFGAVLLTSHDANDAELGFINPVTRTYTSKKVSRNGAVSTEAHDMFSVRPPSEVVVWVCETAGSLSGSEDALRRVWGIPRECPMRVIRIRSRTLDIGEVARGVLMRYIGDRTVSIGDGSISDSVARALDYMRNVIPMAVDGARFVKERHGGNHLVLENQPLRQLNIVSGSQDVSHVRQNVSCVTSLLDKTATKMGKRLHVRRLACPTADDVEVNNRQHLGKWFTEDESRISRWGGVFHDMPDTGSLFSARVYGGMSYTLLWKCAMAIKEFSTAVTEMEVPIEFPRERCVSFYEKISRELVNPVDTPSGGHAVGGAPTHSYGSVAPITPDVPFCEPYPTPDVHAHHRQLLSKLRVLEGVVSAMNEGGSSAKNGSLPKNASLRVAMMGNSYYIVGAKASGSRLVNTRRYGAVSWSNAIMEKVDGITGRGSSYVLSGSTNINIGQDCDDVRVGDILKEVARLRSLVDDDVITSWLEWSSLVRTEYEELVREMGEVIATVDVARSSALVVNKMGYVWPNVHASDECSWVECEGLRHPLIESIRQDVPYVPHTISVGNKDEVPIGRLVFGVNSSGKSSLMKALGIAVVLAQTGMPVPAKDMNLSIFSSLYTRILGNDDLFRGLSTFRVESDEIIRILRDANHKSLVLGDELCSGTEQIGAESLVTASILTLLRRRCAFLFATHLHRVRDIPDLIHHPRLGWNHLRVDVDEKGVMYMDRRLQEGAGPRGYAIDYVERMGGDTATMKEARRIRDMITSEEFSVLSARAWTESNTRGYMDANETRTSWNSQVGIQSVCQICKKRPTEETDHIIPREMAGTMGGLAGVGSVHSGGNLVGLCSICHEQKTRGDIKIHGYKEYFDVASGGTRRELSWEKTRSSPLDVDESDEPDETDDFVRSTVIRMSGFGKTPRQIQGFLRRNGHTIRLSQISDILGEQYNR
jgi:5-methylcytosine-specific restriction endonuclease McrA